MNWQERAGRGGVCDFRKNYDFYFKWLVGKVMSCFIITDEEPTEQTKSINWDYFKINLILNGEICITAFNEKLYACIGARGGAPNEYYLPSIFTIANPVLGSKQVKIDKDGVVIYNSPVDKFVWTSTGYIFTGGLYDLIEQTATLLSDNIISINCVQVNARVNVFFTADSEAQAVAGEVILKKMYAGKPYQILRSDLLEKLGINPLNTSATSQNIIELIELHNYIIASFFQNIGIKANNNMKRERLNTDEVNAQDDFLQISITEMLAAWQAGLDEVNSMYGTKFKVKLNPVLVPELLEEAEPEGAADGEQDPKEAAAAEPEGAAADGEQDPTEAAAAEPEGAAADGEQDPKEEMKEEIEKKEEAVEAIIDTINGKEEDSEEPEEGEKNEPEAESKPTNIN